MKCYISIFLLTCFVLKPATGIRDSKIVGTINNILDNLALEKWEPDESACRQATEVILNGVKNNTLWASWVWDSMQLPVGTFYGSLYHLGNFDQCLKLPWPSQRVQTQYCLVDVKLTALKEHDERHINPYDDVEQYVGAKFYNGMRINTIHLGVCLPAACKPGSVAKISRHIFSFSHLSFEDVVVDPGDCQIAGTVEKPMGYYLFWLIIFTMISACVLVYFYGNTQYQSGSTVSKITRCFCLTRNFKGLAEQYEGEIKIICGMRSLTYGLLILSHYVFMSQSAYGNKIDFEQELTSHPFSKLALHLDLCVDTFLVMSGLLHFRGLMSSRVYQPLKALLKRYLRLLLPLYVLSLMGLTYVLPFIGSGPAWPRITRKLSDPCAKSWWENIFMMNSKCSLTGWYLHCDFQLTVLGTVIIMVYNRNKKTGIILFSLAYVASVVIPAIWSYWQELPGLLWYDFSESTDIDKNKVYNSVYTPFYTRASSYLVGAAMGYIMILYKPQNCRRTISKTASILGFIIGMSLLWVCLQVAVKTFTKGFSTATTAILAALDRTVWSIGICLIIAVCEYGTLPIIEDFLGSKVFVPMSKLSYSGYLCHTFFIYKDIFSLRTPIHFDTISMVTNGLGYVVITEFVCYLIWLFIEAPVTNLINLIFDFNRCPSVQENKLKEASLSRGITKTLKVL